MEPTKAEKRYWYFSVSNLIVNALNVLAIFFMCIGVREMIERGSEEQSLFYIPTIAAIMLYVLGCSLFFRQKNYLFLIAGTAWSLFLFHAYQTYTKFGAYAKLYETADRPVVSIDQFYDYPRNLVIVLVVMSLVHITVILIRMIRGGQGFTGEKS